MRALRLAVALLASGSLATTAAATAAPDRTGAAARVPLTVGPTEVVATYPINPEGAQAPNPVATTDATGVVTAAWSQQAGLHVAQRRLDGTWTAPVTLDTCARPEPYCSISGYNVAVDGTGTATAVWSKPTDTPGRYEVRTASMRPGGAWSAPELLRVGRFASPALVVARNGAMLLTFETLIGADDSVVTATYRAPGASWSAARTRAFRHLYQPATGISDRGVAVLLVRGITGRTSTRVRAYRFSPRTGWSRPQRVAVTMRDDIAPYAMAVGGSGRAVVAWMTGNLYRPSLRARVMDRRGRWGPTSTLSGPTGFESESQGVVTQRSAYVVWTSPHNAIRYAVKAPGKPWRRGGAYPRRTGSLRALDINARGELAIVIHRWPAAALEMDVGLYSPSTGWSGLVAMPWRPDDFVVHGALTAGPDRSAMVMSSETLSSPPTDYRVVAWRVTAAQ